MTAAIEVKQLQYAYQTKPVVNDLSFTVRAGEFFVIIGPNGSGKSTLLKLICGLLTPQSGDLRVLNRSMTDYNRQELARRIAFVPQLAVLDFPFTVREVVAMGRSPHLGLLGLEGSRDREIVAEALDFTGVAHLADRKMNQLSGGESQRVLIARAICQQSQVVLLDEPTAALDLAHQVRIMDLMEQLKCTSGTTVIMVSHDVNLAAMYGERLMLLKAGTKLACGAPCIVLQADTLAEAYGCGVVVDRGPWEGTQRVTPIPAKHQSRLNDGHKRRYHLS